MAHYKLEDFQQPQEEPDLGWLQEAIKRAAEAQRQKQAIAAQRQQAQQGPTPQAQQGPESFLEWRQKLLSGQLPVEQQLLGPNNSPRKPLQ